MKRFNLSGVSAAKLVEAVLEGESSRAFLLRMAQNSLSTLLRRAHFRLFDKDSYRRILDDPHRTLYLVRSCRGWKLNTYYGTQALTTSKVFDNDAEVIAWLKKYKLA